MEKETALLKQLEGKQTIDTIVQMIGLKKASALNLISRLKKEGYVKTEGGGKQKRIYTISSKKVIEENGIFTVINRYSKIKVIPSFVHVVHGKYRPEDALIDAILLKDFRTLQAALYLFNHITDWSRLHFLSKKRGIEAIVGALYDSARQIIKTRRMPFKMRNSLFKKRPPKKEEIIKGLHTDDFQLKKVEDIWNIIIPFSKKDRVEMK